MAIFYDEYIMETKSQAINNLKNKSTGKYTDKVFGYGDSTERNYDKFENKLEKVNKPMKTADDYREREKFYSDSNKLQNKFENEMEKRRKNAKRPILGYAQRKLNRKADEEYRGTGRGRVNLGCLYNNNVSYHDLSNIKEACEYILSVIDESYDYDDEY